MKENVTSGGENEKESTKQNQEEEEEYGINLE